MSEAATLVSVVVIGKNEGTRLERCLTSVVAMHRDAFETEVIYVDSGSTDDSVAIAAKMGARTIALTVANPTAALGRNAGWQQSAGKFVMFLDGDTVLNPEFIVRALQDFQPKTAVVWGHRRELYPFASVYQRVLDLDWMYVPGESAFCGGDALFRREVLEYTNGFDPYLIAGEEPELCQRVIALGYTILHVDRPMTGHDLAMTNFGQYWRRATRAGHAYAEVSERFADSHNHLWKHESRGNRVRASILVGTAFFTSCATLLLASVWPIAVWCAIICVLATRTAWKARWKTANWTVLLLYGVHSLFQHLPICIGQLRYRLNRQRGQRSSLVEYK